MCTSFAQRFVNLKEENVQYSTINIQCSTATGIVNLPAGRLGIVRSAVNKRL